MDEINIKTVRLSLHEIKCSSQINFNETETSLTLNAEATMARPPQKSQEPLGEGELWAAVWTAHLVQISL